MINLVTSAKALLPSEIPFIGPGGREFGATSPPSRHRLRERIQAWNCGWVISVVLRELPQQLPFLRTSPVGHRLPPCPCMACTCTLAGFVHCCPPRGWEMIMHYGPALHIPGFLGVWATFHVFVGHGGLLFCGLASWIFCQFSIVISYFLILKDLYIFLKWYIYSGILLSHKKEWSNVSYHCVDGPGDCHTERSKSKTNIIWYHLCVESKKKVQVNLCIKQSYRHRKQSYAYHCLRGREG